jgi:hypothetical protein
MKQEATVGVGTMRKVKALYYASKLFGLAPFKLRTQHIALKVIFDTKLRENVLYTLWSLFLLILMIFGGIMQINLIIKRISEGAKLVSVFSQLFSYMSSITSLIIVNWKRDLAPIILKQLHKIDGLLLEYEEQVRETKRSQYVFVTKTFILLFSAMLLMAFAFVSWGQFAALLDITLLCLSNFISLMALIQVLGFLSYLRHKLSTLNLVVLCVFKKRPQKLSSDHRNYKHALSSKVACDVSRSDNTQKNPICVINTNYSGILFCGTQLNQNSVSSNILCLRNTYNSIYDLLGIVSSLYGFPILVQLAQNFLVLVGVSYLLINFLYSLEAHGPNPFSGFPFVASIGFYLLFCVLRLLIITVNCENLRSENKRLSDSVHKLLLQQDMAADSVHQLQLFSFQLLSCKMEFSAAGLFSVDLPYLYSSIAAIVTFFVVLLQIK